MNVAQGLFIGAITGVIGMAYFVYGKKQCRPVPLVAGMALIVYPYFIASLVISIAIGVALMALPFIFRIDL